MKTAQFVNLLHIFGDKVLNRTMIPLSVKLKSFSFASVIFRRFLFAMKKQKGTLKPRRRPSILCDEGVANCDELLNSIPDFNTLFQRQTSEEIQALLDEFLSTDTSSEGGSSETEKYNTKTKVDAAFSKLMGD
mgnify:CR=1 FL=1